MEYEPGTQLFYIYGEEGIPHFHGGTVCTPNCEEHNVEDPHLDMGQGWYHRIESDRVYYTEAQIISLMQGGKK